MRFQTSLSHPAPIDQQESKSRRHLTLPVPLNSQSQAERYILSRSQMVTNSNEQQDISPETPSSMTGTGPRTFQLPMSHDEYMRKWNKEKTNEIIKKQKHRYVYGTPPSSARTAFSLPMYLTPSIQSNKPLSSQSNDTQPSIPVARAVKNDNSTEQPKKIESRRKFTAV
jgi:hypothetical protein